MITKILVIDNEPPIRQAFVKMLRHFCDESFDIYEADGVKSGITAMESFKPNILFLDIELDDGTGFDFLNSVDYRGVQLIFTTAYNQYAIRAFEYSAIQYLLKPVSPSALQKTIVQATSKMNEADMANQIQVLLNSLQKPKDIEQKIVLKDINGIYFVKISDIIYCEASGPYTEFSIEGGDKIITSRNLKEYETLLESFYFARCHHGFLVNLRKIKSIDKNDGNSLVLEGGNRIPVSTRKKKRLWDFWANFFWG
ncbi:MAG: response regulator transcription factor [Saprospiraceae bacterium]|nr:response regulator transcription factor [Saprospiraceae bacterium]